MHRNLVLSTMLIVSAVVLNGKSKHSKLSPPNASQDEIEVVAHLPVISSAVTRFFTTEHYGHDYLYAEHVSGKTVTLIDVTKMSHPAVLAEITYPTGRPGNLIAVTGNAALIETSQNTNVSSGVTPETFRIMSFADPLHPTVKQEFNGVTSMGTDEKRDLIFLATSQGIWILQEHYATNPIAEKEWEHMMLDNR